MKLQPIWFRFLLDGWDALDGRENGVLLWWA